MEAWNITKYASPYLAISAVWQDESTGEVVVSAEGNEYIIEHGRDTPANEIVKRLDALREPGSLGWRDVLADKPKSDWRELLKEMDYLGLMRDGSSGSIDHREEELRQVRTAIDTCIDRVLLDVKSDKHAELLASAHALGSHFLALTIDFSRQLPLTNPLRDDSTRALDSWEILGRENFYQQLAMVQALYQRDNAPLSLVSSTIALLTLQNRLDQSTNLPAGTYELLRELVGGAYSTLETQRHLNGLAECLVSSVESAKAKRFCESVYEPKECLSGIQFMLEIERVAREVSLRVGIPEYLKALTAPDADLVLVHGRYLQDYQVTTRFPEMIAAILPKRLSAGLRTKAFRYYAEEVGHDVLEYQSCRELGMTDEQIYGAQPLPLHYAYVDVFTHVARMDPVAYAVSIFITEGVLGVESPLEEPYKKLVGEFLALDKHIMLNEKYHHTSIPRLLMTEVKAVSPATQRLAMKYMLLVFELNYRAWDDLLDHYLRGDQRFMRVLPNAVPLTKKAAAA